jgi:hypothetical protein
MVGYVSKGWSGVPGSCVVISGYFVDGKCGGGLAVTHLFIFTRLHGCADRNSNIALNGNTLRTFFHGPPKQIFVRRFLVTLVL